MKLFDSNLIIYSSQEAFAYLRPLLLASDSFVSVVSKVETLGFHQLTLMEKGYLEDFFELAKLVDVTALVIDKAVELRQQRRMSLGDALIGATALIYQYDLYTNNIADFATIPGLTVVNPLTEN
jgi:predicted nucleic acid-binding protein